jgi:hypothetical protein
MRKSSRITIQDILIRLLLLLGLLCADSRESWGRLSTLSTTLDARISRSITPTTKVSAIKAYRYGKGSSVER